jgi:hypothetical protein
MIMGSKEDLKDQREVDAIEVQDFCTKHNILHKEVSAKEYRDVEKAFNILLQQFVSATNSKNQT